MYDAFNYLNWKTGDKAHSALVAGLFKQFETQRR